MFIGLLGVDPALRQEGNVFRWCTRKNIVFPYGRGGCFRCSINIALLAEGKIPLSKVQTPNSGTATRCRPGVNDPPGHAGSVRTQTDARKTLFRRPLVSDSVRTRSSQHELNVQCTRAWPA